MRARSVELMIEEDRLSETFAALANTTRRAILARLADGAATVAEVEREPVVKLDHQEMAHGHGRRKAEHVGEKGR